MFITVEVVQLLKHILRGILVYFVSQL